MESYNDTAILCIYPYARTITFIQHYVKRCKEVKRAKAILVKKREIIMTIKIRMLYLFQKTLVIYVKKYSKTSNQSSLVQLIKVDFKFYKSKSIEEA